MKLRQIQYFPEFNASGAWVVDRVIAKHGIYRRCHSNGKTSTITETYDGERFWIVVK